MVLIKVRRTKRRSTICAFLAASYASVICGCGLNFSVGFTLDEFEYVDEREPA
jgi:hypothetical protein